MKRTSLLVAVLLLSAPTLLPAQSVVDWTEGPGPLGLGYRVPVPVDTPLPFDGFRTHAGLHTRHQDLTLAHEFISAAVVGQTRRNRDIWAYRLGRGGNATFEGLPRAALQFTGGIHAREWQSPEVVTGLMELLAEGHGDGNWLDYILDQTSIVVIPVLNVDGFLATQRYPSSNWLGVDNRHPDSSPRDGRMRRKNLRGSDGNLFTASDLLAGVDLNRNNDPAWPGPPDTGDPDDLTYRGDSPASEPETQALLTAAELAPADQLRFYADMHSFTKVFFSVQTNNSRLNGIQERVLAMASDHHADLPGSKRYVDSPSDLNNGIGTTSEYFAHKFRVPSLTWEIEPGNGGGTEYGGFGNNGHDGFILPESEITRVRENLAETMAAVAYHMAGPPHIVRADLLDEDGRFTYWSARWSDARDGQRELVTRSVRPMRAGTDYRLRLVFSKPMRWREDGEVVPFPGRLASSLGVDAGFEIDGQALEVTVGEPQWGTEPGSWIGARPSYRDSTLTLPIRLEDSQANITLLEQSADGRTALTIDTADMTGHRLDADPSTPVRFRTGFWRDYDSGGDEPDEGGSDRTLELEVESSSEISIQAVDSGHTANWFNPGRSGEGWMLEILPDDRALAYWFTFDAEGNPRWLIGSGSIEGNRIEFPELIAASGARFGSAFDAEDIEFETVGSARMVFTGCQSGWYEYEAYDHHRTVDFQALTTTWATHCGPPDIPTIIPDRALLSGSWYDPAQPGQGLTVQWLSSESMLLVWFTYDAEGRPYWIIGQSEEGSTDPIVFPELLAIRGPAFGDAFDPDDAEQLVWGQAELTLACEQGLFEYEAMLEGFESGTLPLERLTELAGMAGLGCEL